MENPNWRAKILPTLMVAGVVSLLLSLLIGGFIVYQWVLAIEATATALVLFAFWIRYYRNDPRESKWPPLLPLAIIAASGGAKSFFVATGKDTPWVVIVVLLTSVVWFGFSSWRIVRVERRLSG